MDYTQASEKLVGRCKDSRKLENHTYLVRRGSDFAIRLHDTDVVTLHKDGSVTLDSGGWKTVTTKTRMNEYSRIYWGHAYSVFSDKGVWKLTTGGNKFTDWTTKTLNPKYQEYVFRDGITVYKDGRVTGAAPAGADRKTLKLNKRVSQYVAGYMAALVNGKVSAPGGGDCFACQLKSQNGKTTGEEFHDSSHIDGHMKEKYYVGSLLARALEVMPCSPAMRWWVDARFLNSDGLWRGGDASFGFCKQQVAKALKRYILRQFGLQA